GLSRPLVAYHRHIRMPLKQRGGQMRKARAAAGPNSADGTISICTGVVSHGGAGHRTALVLMYPVRSGGWRPRPRAPRARRLVRRERDGEAGATLLAAGERGRALPDAAHEVDEGVDVGAGRRDLRHDLAAVLAAEQVHEERLRRRAA